MRQPEVILHGRGNTARFRSEAVLLTASGETTRIPVEAVETVRIRGPKRRTAEIVLTSATPGEGRVYALASTSAEAVAAFAHAVNAALPQRDEAERCFDGAQLVTVEKPERVARRPPGRGRAIAAVVAAVVLPALAPLGGSDPGMAEVWLKSLIPLVIGGPLAYGVVLSGWTWWVLRRRGITVSADEGAWTSDDDGDHRRYFVTDAEGARREVEINPAMARSRDGLIEVTYDPLVPLRASVRWSTGGRILLAGCYLIAVPIALASVLWPPFYIALVAADYL